MRSLDYEMLAFYKVENLLKSLGLWVVVEGDIVVSLSFKLNNKAPPWTCYNIKQKSFEVWDRFVHVIQGVPNFLLSFLERIQSFYPPSTPTPHE